MAGSITHAHQTTLPNNPGADVSATVWNAGHTFTLGPSDVGLPDIADSGGSVTVSTATANVPGLIVSGMSSAGASTAGTSAVHFLTTWNTTDAGRGVTLDVTGTAFHNGSELLNLKVGGTSALLVDYNNNGLVEFSSSTGNMSFFSVSGNIQFGTAGLTQWIINKTTGALEANTNASLNSGAVTVANLPTGVLGARNYVTDATQTLTAGIGTVVAGLGTNKVPVNYDGTNWRIG